MLYCCVPRCKSSSKQRTPGILFHDIPSDPELRVKWLKFIFRDDWTPNTTSCYSTVCSRHVGSSDFKGAAKFASPRKTLFPAFSKSILRTCSLQRRERSDAYVRKSEAAAPVNTPPPKHRALETQLDPPLLTLNELPSVDVASPELSRMDCTATELPLPIQEAAEASAASLPPCRWTELCRCRHYSQFWQ
ncbi:hypothetical protein HPB51_027745 [Rhipicephalus microplus]|uniref:THAP-type domain-containing protein n=1 Tax=Rhipicephalus microplus TaxID=6941 RepID=A0A9J6CZG6_RHIMP|nr:hypothetical protein HPB51_027745 [Rhipicephalus microplus]